MQEISFAKPVYAFEKERVVEVAKESVYCSCIATARMLGANLPKGDAKDLKRNSPPTVGGVVILRYGSVYHTSYIQYLFPGGMWVQEGNKIPCKYSERFIFFTDPNIIGFWSEF